MLAGHRTSCYLGLVAHAADGVLSYIEARAASIPLVAWGRVSVYFLLTNSAGLHIGLRQNFLSDVAPFLRPAGEPDVRQVLVGSLARNLSLVSAVVKVNLLGIPAHSLDLEIDFDGWQPLLRRLLWDF